MQSGSHTQLYNSLRNSLYGSSMMQRQSWAKTIVKEDIDLKELCLLLKEEKKIAIRFLWFLTEVGMEDSRTLYKALPFLFKLCDQLDPVYKQSFTSYWLIAGIPKEQEAKAIDKCFDWLISPDTNITIKSRAMWVLAKLTKKYPELKNELRLSIENQMDKYSKDFEKRALKILRELEK